jgi:arylsulfatase A-like enzyme/Flp pilus assembly protein TadD
MSALALLYASGWIIWIGSSCAERSNTARVPENPNVVLITLDTTRADYLGCYGSLASSTPTIDRLAAEGTLFTNCRSCSPLTLPSHSSIMTATYPYVHGVRQNGTYRLVSGNLTLAEVLKEAGYSAGAAVGSFVLNRRFGLDQGFDLYRDFDAEKGAVPLAAERGGDQVCDEALGLLRSAGSEPFLLWVHFYDPHFPYVALDQGQSSNAYAQEIAFMDAQLGRLMEEIRARGTSRKTLVVVVGDHGEGLNDHDEMFHGYFLYSTSLHVPLIFWGPDLVPSGKRVDSLVRTVDIAPTVLDLLGCPALERAQGTSLVPLIRNGARDLGLAAYAETTDSLTQLTLAPLRSLAVGDWKYILAPKPELYRLDTDPGEKRNLIAGHPEVAERMRRQLRELIANAPRPAAAEDATISMNAADLGRLESLGYVASGVGPEGTGRTELDRFEPRGGDPKDFTRVIRANSMGMGLLFQGKYELAERLLRQAAEALPDAPTPVANLANAIHMQWRLQEAAPLYQRALSLAPDSHLIRRRYAGLCVDARRWEDAVAQLSLLLAKHPADAEAQFNMGVALGSLGRLTESIEHFERAREVNPLEVRYLHGMAVTYTEQREYDKAVECLRQALEIDPGQERLQEDLKRVLDLKGEQ